MRGIHDVPAYVPRTVRFSFTRVLDQRIDFPTNDTRYNNDIHNIGRVLWVRLGTLQLFEYIVCMLCTLLIIYIKKTIDRPLAFTIL